MRFTVGETDHDASAGTLVMVPPGVPHTFANVSDEPAVMVSTFTPAFYVQYFRDLRDGGQELTQQRNLDVMSHYATTPAFPPKP